MLTLLVVFSRPALLPMEALLTAAATESPTDALRSAMGLPGSWTSFPFWKRDRRSDQEFEALDMLSETVVMGDSCPCQISCLVPGRLEMKNPRWKRKMMREKRKIGSFERPLTCRAMTSTDQAVLLACHMLRGRSVGERRGSLV